MRGDYIKKGRRNSLNLSLEGKLNERASREALSDRLATRLSPAKLELLGPETLLLRDFQHMVKSREWFAPHLEQMAQLSKHRRRESIKAEPLAGRAP